MLHDSWTMGINHGSHDAAVALAYNGRLKIVIEQERLSRKKRAIGEAPTDALASCLSFAGIQLQDIKLITLGSDHDGLANFLQLSPHERRMILPYDDPERLFPPSIRAAGRVPPVISVPHHLAHAASAYWPSGYSDAAIVVLDAMGESTAGILAYGNQNEIEVLRHLPIEGSLGFFYEAASAYTGLGKNDAGKFMGLASYGNPRMPIPLTMKNGVPVWNGISSFGLRGREMIDARINSLVHYFEATCFPYCAGLREEIMAYKDFAASVQHAFEDVLLELASEVKELTKSRNLVLAGGVALNCTANGRLAGSGLYKRIYVQPAAHDAGVAIGAALLAARNIGEDPTQRREMSVFLGPSESHAQVRQVLLENGFEFVEMAIADLLDKIASRLSKGAVVAWHQGRAENGPRALGARSLLGDPRSRRTLVRMNAIKGREMWRPLAPSVPVEYFQEYFIGSPNKHMLFAVTVREHKRSVIPAVVHVDGSARPHVVYRREQPVFWQLIQRFNDYSGVPVVVNTSLNGEEEPIANSCFDTISLLANRDIDCAAIGRFLVEGPGGVSG